MPDNNTLFLIFTGLDGECSEFDIETKSIVKAFNKQFNVQCFPTNTSDLTDFDAFMKTRADDVGCLIESTATRIIFLAHSFGAIVALKLVEHMKLNDRAALILIDPSTSISPVIQKHPTLAPIITDLTVDLTCPILLLTYFQNSLLKIKLEETNRLTKVSNRMRILSLQTFLERNISKLNSFNSLLGANPNVNIVVLGEPHGIKYTNPHFIHINDPQEVIGMIRKFLSLHGLVRTGGTRKTRRAARLAKITT